MSLFKKLILSSLFFPLFFLLLSFLPHQKIQAQQKTFVFNGNVFIDTNSNGLKNSGEKCYNGRYTIQIPGKTVSVNGKEDCSAKYTIAQTSTANSLSIRLEIPSGYNATKLSYTLKSDNQQKTANGSSVTLSGSADVLFGIKKENNPPDNKKNCDVNHPGLDINPVQNKGKKGVAKDYSVKVTNNDKGKDCDAKDKFSVKITSVVPSGWKADLTKDLLEVKKGGKDPETTKLTVQSPTQGVKDGDIKSFSVTVQRKGGKQKVTRPAKYKVVDKDGGGGGGGGDETTPPPDNGDCVRKTPELSAEANKTHAKPGGQIIYTVKVKNGDQGKCAKINLNLQRLLPNDKWTGTWDPKNEFDLAKGATKSFKLSVKSPQNAALGTKKIKINLRNKENKVLETKEVDFVVSNEKPEPTPTPTPIEDPCPPFCPESVNLNITIGADGLGTTKRIPLGGNKNPEPDFANLDVFLYYAAVSDKLNNSLAYQTNVTFNYNPEIEKLEGTVTLPFDFPNGAYNLYATGPRYKISQLPGSFTFGGTDKTIVNSNFYLIAGDINKVAESNNNIDQNDYNVLLSCSIYSQDTSTCDRDPNYKEYSDLNYDGIVNEDDFTLWLKEVGNQEGAPLPTPIEDEEPIGEE